MQSEIGRTDLTQPDRVDPSEDPTFVSPPQHYGQDPEDTADLSQLIKEQLKMIQKLQRRVEDNPDINTRDLREIATACSGLISNVHKTGELVKTIETYRLFVGAVLNWIKQQPDSTGQALLEALLETAAKMNARDEISSLI